MSNINHRVLGGLGKPARVDRKKKERISGSGVSGKTWRNNQAIDSLLSLDLSRSLSQFLTPQFLLYWNNFDIHYRLESKVLVRNID